MGNWLSLSLFLSLGVGPCAIISGIKDTGTGRTGEGRVESNDKRTKMLEYSYL